MHEIFNSNNTQLYVNKRKCGQYYCVVWEKVCWY